MYLTENKIKYVFYHLGHHVADEVFDPENCLVLQPGESLPFFEKSRVIFRLSPDESPSPCDVVLQDKTIPVLFSLEEGAKIVFRKDQYGNIIFEHDLLSSAFYLLSGQQELNVCERDQYGRFPYAQSIQRKLGVVHLPLVNYYFEMIINGFEAFAQARKLKIARRSLFKNFGFFLSHDVDRVAFHHPLLVLHKIASVIGISKSNGRRAEILRLALKGVLFNLNPWRGEDPWWNFDRMIDFEKQLGIRSTFFFLKREDGFVNSLYKFSHKKIKNLISTLKADEFEVGLHGTFRSVNEPDCLMRQKRELSRVLGHEPLGIRQHYLRFVHPQTFDIQSNAGLRYDTSLGFAEHDGYRNGYCLPFHPYDFECDRMMDIWEIPLVMMEVSVLRYRNSDFMVMQQAVDHYMAEARKFGGIFSLLWHNCRINEYEISGITVFYERLLKDIVGAEPEVVTGELLIQRMKNHLAASQSDQF